MNRFGKKCNREYISTSKLHPARDAHGPGWPADRAALTFLGQRAERAENWPKPLPIKKQVLHAKPKFLIKIT